MALRFPHNDSENQAIVFQQFSDRGNHLELRLFVVPLKNKFQFDLTSLHVLAYAPELHWDTIWQSLSTEVWPR